jgi:NDP-sugar pyrophosphorylase family protein
MNLNDSRNAARPATPPVSVAILAGGLGTRLRPVVPDRPKVLAEVGGRPFLAHWLDELNRQRFRSVILCTGYRADQVQATLGNRHGQLTLDYSPEPHPLGTAGALRHALPLLPREWLLVLNGDSFLDLSFQRFWEAHRQAMHRISIAVTPVSDCRRFGRVRFDARGTIEAFEEKNTREGAGWINAGVYLLHRSCLERLPQAGVLSLERDLFPAHVADGIYAFPTVGRFLDIGTPESYALADSVLVPGETATASTSPRP